MHTEKSGPASGDSLELAARLGAALRKAEDGSRASREELKTAACAYYLDRLKREGWRKVVIAVEVQFGRLPSAPAASPRAHDPTTWRTELLTEAIGWCVEHCYCAD
jgi:hypothetical protein